MRCCCCCCARLLLLVFYEEVMCCISICVKLQAVGEPIEPLNACWPEQADLLQDWLSQSPVLLPAALLACMLHILILTAAAAVLLVRLQQAQHAIERGVSWVRQQQCRVGMPPAQQPAPLTWPVLLSPNSQLLTPAKKEDMLLLAAADQKQ
jgi:hypothetical protein